MSRPARSAARPLALGFALFLSLLVLGGAGWLRLTPPDLVRVGTGFAAKTVCSQVFIAGRIPEDVLRDDVQAPGHPLLRAVRVTVDPEARVVRATLLGFGAPAAASHHDTLGCALIHDADLRPRERPEPIRPAASGVAQSLLMIVPDPNFQALLDDDALTGPGFRAAVILHEGRVVAERYAPGFGPDTPLYGWSMTKTVTAALVGTLLGEGRLSLDDSELFDAWHGDARAAITVAQLLGMESGFQWDEAYGSVSDVNRMLFLSHDMAAQAMASPSAAPPGSEFRYASGTSVLLSHLWQRRLPDPSEAARWPRTALFDPLGMTQAVLEADASGTFVGSSFMMATAREWARFGWFLAEDGEVDGNPLLPGGYAAWMRQATETSNGRYGRGQLWRRGPGGPDAQEDEASLPSDLFWLLGHDGQSVAVSPAHALVVARLGLTPERLGYRPQPLVRAAMDLVPGSPIP
jgi:CubicO group peptidase (beta-lactamase class C family)